jgi:DNA-binding FrmR family transcriptional regulator
MIDITGLDYNQVKAFTLSRYSGEATAAERMASSSPDASDPFEAIASVRSALEQFAQELRQQSSEMSAAQVIFALSKRIRRSD